MTEVRGGKSRELLNGFRISILQGEKGILYMLDIFPLIARLWNILNTISVCLEMVKKVNFMWVFFLL